MHETGGISDRDYSSLGEMIQSACGIAFPASKRIMVETRLAKRARLLGLDSLSAYVRYLRSPRGLRDEFPRLIDAVTTHKTDFFREPAHFDHLTGRLLPALEREKGAGTQRPLQVWSAACSTGEEPYTLAMVLSDYARSLTPRAYRFEISASDISGGVLETAAAAIYPEAAIAPVPEHLRQRYVLRSRNRSRAMVRMAPEIRSHVTFRRINLMDGDYGFGGPLDVVFCRNVMIYFDRPMQQEMIRRIVSVLAPGGYLVMGHAESLSGMELGLEQESATIYRRPGSEHRSRVGRTDA